MSIIELIASDNYIAVNRDLIRLLGLEGAVVLGELASQHRYWKNNNGLTDDGYFYSTSDNIEKSTGLKEARQRAVIKKLVSQKVIDVKLKGLPATRHFKINEVQLLSMMQNSSNQLSGTSSAKIEELEQPKSQINKKELTKTNNKNDNNIYHEIIEHLNTKAHTAFKASSKATQSQIHARLAEGFTADDCKTVIDKKCAEWMGTDWQKFLRPSTLFGTKFESYLNAPMPKQFGKSGIEVKKQDDDLADVF